jgi:hypothetical protein
MVFQAGYLPRIKNPNVVESLAMTLVEPEDHLRGQMLNSRHLG